MPRLKEIGARPVAFIRSVRDLTVREKQFLVSEIL